MKQALRFACCLFLLFLAAPSLVWGQAATVGTITGQVVDQTGAVVPGAQVTLTDVSTKIVYGQPTNSVGRFVFSDVKPGTYDVTVVAKGFRKVVVPGQEVIVGQSVQLNLTLEVGAATQTVEVKSVVGAELQTLNSTVGSTLGGDTLLALPNQNRDATSLLVFQPMTAPTFGGAEGNTTGGQVAGQMSDQNTFTLDGGNASDDLAGDNGYVSGNRGYVGPQAAIPTPVESIEEFKVSTNNQTADFSSSSGGQVMLVTKRGSNTFHGSAYDYFQANWLDARGWNLNSTYGENVPTVKQHQNRFGGSFGGPILPSKWGGKTYFYGNYEGRRYPYANGRYERNVPSALLRNGVVQEPNSAGVWEQYPLKTSTACGGAANLPCDPRGIGINPIVSQMWTKYMPLPNDCPGAGDHYNTCGYYAALKLGIRDDFMVARMDHDFGSKWRAFASYRWFSLKDPTTNQVDIGGLLPGDTLGVPASASNDPGNPRYGVIGLTGSITPTVTNEFHVSMLRNDWNWNRAGVPTGQLGIPGGLEVETGSESSGCGNCVEPLTFDTQNARNRLWDGQDWTWSDSVSWLRGNHYLQMGGQFMHFYDIHERDDEVTAALTQLVYQVGNGNSDLLWTSSLYPQTCGSGATSSTYCMNSSSRGSYENVAAMLMGIVSQSEQVFARGGSNFALTGANALEDHSIIDSYSLYFTDSWKIRPNLTLNYGLEWGTTMPPYEKNGIQDILTDSTGQAMSFDSMMNNAQAAALKGQVNNPVWGFTPILGMGSKIKYPYTPFYGGFSPRVSLAYSPKGSSIGFMNKLLGDKKTVMRGGYVRVYDRMNAVNLVLTPLLGYGFGQPIRGIGGNMNGSFTNTASSVTVANAFRIGTDGNTAPFPTPTQTLPIPAEPGVNTPGATSLTSLDPNTRPGDDDQIDFTIQRELPGGLIVEAGYNGRWAKHISVDLDTDAIPVMMKLGGQSFTQAYYNLFLADQQAQKTGVTPTVAAQPFFETALGGANSAFCSGYANCTTAVEAAEGLNGTGNISFYSPWAMFQDFDTAANGPAAGPGGSEWNFPGCTGCPILPTSVGHYGYNNNQVTDGFANYQALFVTVQKRAGHGLVLSGNYSYSHTLSIYDINQEYTGYSVNYPWDLHWNYMPAIFDRTQVLNILANYQLPFGKGKYFATKNPVLDRIIGGWSFSPVFSWGTGLPIETETAYGAEFGSNWNTGLDAGEVPLGNTAQFGHSAQVNYHASSTTASYLGPSQGSLVGYTNDPYPDCGGKACAPNTYGVNLFKNPAAVFNSYRPALLGLDTSTYSFGPYYGQHRWNLDFTIAKQTHIKENWNVTFYAQFLNAFNHMEYGDPGLSYLDPADFGNLTGQYNSPRVVELGARVSF
jgi:hypothetical protein